MKLFKKNKNSALTEGLISSTELFVQGDQEYHTFRIPGILCCPNNLVLVFCEVRSSSTSDLGEIYCGMRKSLDGGKTWEPLRIILKCGEFAVQNPCPVYVPETKEIIMPFLINRKKPYLLKSKDLGETWSEPIFLENLFEPDWSVNGPCPGHSIKLSSGRLFTCCHNNSGEKTKGKIMLNRGVWNTFFIYSDDFGKKWKRSEVLDYKTNESMAVELEDGRILVILRQNDDLSNNKKILYTWSDDGGLTFSNPVESSDLSGPVCQASIVRFTSTKHFKKSRLLFSNPDNERFRKNMTIRLSYDEGKSWPVKKTLWKKKSAYSDLAVLEDGTIGCVFECGKRYSAHKIMFVKCNVEWITDGKDQLKPR